jgi:hypothetical protein
MDCDNARATTIPEAKIVPEGYEADRAHSLIITSRDPRGLPLDILSLATFLYEDERKTGPRLEIPAKLHWDRVSRGVAGASWSEFCAKVAALRPGRLWRHAQAGDLPGFGPQIDGTLLQELVFANAGKNVIAFTHKPVLGYDPAAVANRRWIDAAIKAGFTINLSADNPAHADRLAELGIAPVVTVLARGYARKAVRHRFKRRRAEWAETIGEWRDRTASLPRNAPAGRRIAVCPATYSDATCKSCGACARIRDAVIGFPAHGAWRRVESAMAARDVPAGESWVFREHRTMAEVIAEETAAA